MSCLWSLHLSMPSLAWSKLFFATSKRPWALFISERFFSLISFVSLLLASSNKLFAWFRSYWSCFSFVYTSFSFWLSFLLLSSPLYLSWYVSSACVFLLRSSACDISYSSLSWYFLYDPWTQVIIFLVIGTEVTFPWSETASRVNLKPFNAASDKSVRSGVSIFLFIDILLSTSTLPWKRHRHDVATFLMAEYFMVPAAVFLSRISFQYMSTPFNMPPSSYTTSSSIVSSL